MLRITSSCDRDLTFICDLIYVYSYIQSRDDFCSYVPASIWCRHCVAGCCSMLQSVVVGCSVLQCVAVGCSGLQLQCVAVCGSVWQCVAVPASTWRHHCTQRPEHFLLHLWCFECAS